MTLEHAAKIREIIEAALDERFRELKVWDVQIAEGFGEDGDRLLKIYIIFEGNKKVDAIEVLGLPRRVIPKLQAADESAFPIFSFVSKSDWGRLKAASA